MTKVTVKTPEELVLLRMTYETENPGLKIRKPAQLPAVFVSEVVTHLLYDSFTYTWVTEQDLKENHAADPRVIRDQHEEIP